LILRDISKFYATRCLILRLECTKFYFQNLLGEITALPELCLKGPTSKGREGEEGKGKGDGKEMRRGGEEK